MINQIARNIISQSLTQKGLKFSSESSTLSPLTQKYIDQEKKFGCNNYHPLPVVIERGEGAYVWDVDGNKYIDFLSAYSAVNQGHNHPKIQNALIKQLDKITLTSRAFYNNRLGPAEQYMSKTFKYDKVLFMNGGVEAPESAVKFARRWAYEVKRVQDDKATVIFMKGNFWGRSIAACASSDDPGRYNKFGPFNGLNFDLIEYNDIEAFKSQIVSNSNLAAIILEPIQGEKGVIIPQPGYLRELRQLCTQNKILLMVDEVQVGLGRCGKLLCSDWENIKPDVVCLGKALSGGFLPISAVLADDQVMNCIRPGDHGSTFGGNPLSAVVAQQSVQVLIEEGMIENSRKMGELLLKNLRAIKEEFPQYVKEVRGLGLFCALEFSKESTKSAWDLCIRLKELGLLAQPTQNNIIRFSPTLILTETEVNQSSEIIRKALQSL